MMEKFYLEKPANQQKESNRVPLSFEFKKEFQRTLERVDFSCLEGIFNQLRRRSGVNENFRILDKGSISIKPEKHSDPFSGDYDSRSNKIRIFYPSESDVFASYEELRNEVLCILIHEETHAAGKNTLCNIWEERKNRVTTFFLRGTFESDAMGYSQDKIRKGRAFSDFTYFNEGVTEKIAEQVYIEYLSQTGDRSFFSTSDRQVKYSETYPIARALVTTFAEVIAFSSNIPVERVWEAIMHGYMTGIQLNESELQKSFDEIFFPGFIKSIGEEEKDNEEDLPMKELQLHLQTLSLPQDALQRIKMAFEKFEKTTEESSQIEKE